jgi:hypothetical protein
MIMNEDEKWQKLLTASASTFAGDAEPPYGFVTATLTRLRTENRQQEEFERIGWRALLASLAALMVAAAITVTVSFSDHGTEFEPGVRSFLQMESIQVS